MHVLFSKPELFLTDDCNMLETIVLHFSVTLENDSCGVLCPVYVHKLLKNSEGISGQNRLCHFLAQPHKGCVQSSTVPKRVALGVTFCTRSKWWR